MNLFSTDYRTKYFVADDAARPMNRWRPGIAIASTSVAREGRWSHENHVEGVFIVVAHVPLALLEETIARATAWCSGMSGGTAAVAARDVAVMRVDHTQPCMAAVALATYEDTKDFVALDHVDTVEEAAVKEWCMQLLAFLSHCNEVGYKPDIRPGLAKVDQQNKLRLEAPLGERVDADADNLQAIAQPLLERVPDPSAAARALTEPGGWSRDAALAWLGTTA